MKGVWGESKASTSKHNAAEEALRGAKSELLLQAVIACTSTGAALMVGVTRDNGAVVLTLMWGDKRPKVYCANANELNEALTDLIESVK